MGSKQRHVGEECIIFGNCGLTRQGFKCVPQVSGNYGHTQAHARTHTRTHNYTVCIH